jgi:N-acylneuraminate cytidylyltransferase
VDKKLCIIPARGGSKRIPGKNLKDFLGKPIIVYSIEAALQSELFDEVMVSTDDQKIAEVAKSLGAKVPFMRSAENSDDFATTLDVVKEVLVSYQKKNKIFQKICIIYPTAPFVTDQRLREGFKALEHFDAAVPVTAYSYPVWRSLKIKDQCLSYQWPEFEKSRSQDLPKLYHDAGQWYWIKTNKMYQSLLPEKTAAILLSNLEVQDIDEEVDWKLAEMKFKLIQQKTLREN